MSSMPSTGPSGKPSAARDGGPTKWGPGRDRIPGRGSCRFQVVLEDVNEEGDDEQYAHDRPDHAASHGGSFLFGG